MNELAVSPEIVSDVVIVTADGSESVTAPVEADAVIWFAVPAIDVTPVLAIYSEPDPAVMLIPVPEPTVAGAYTPPLVPTRI